MPADPLLFDHEVERSKRAHRRQCGNADCAGGKEFVVFDLSRSRFLGLQHGSLLLVVLGVSPVVLMF